MENSQKGFSNIILIIAVVILASVLGYVTLVKKSVPFEQHQSNNSQNTQTVTPQPPRTAVLKDLQVATVTPTTLFTITDARHIIETNMADAMSAGTDDTYAVRGVNFPSGCYSCKLQYADTLNSSKVGVLSYVIYATAQNYTFAPDDYMYNHKSIYKVKFIDAQGHMSNEVIMDTRTTPTAPSK